MRPAARTAAVTGGLIAVLAIASASGAPDRAPARALTPDVRADLRKIDDVIQEVQKDPFEAGKAVHVVGIYKSQLIGEPGLNPTLYGTCPFEKIFYELEPMDRSLEEAANYAELVHVFHDTADQERAARSKQLLLEAAEGRTRDIVKSIERCAGAGSAAAQHAAKLSRAVSELGPLDGVSEIKAVAKKATGEKRKILAGQLISGCDVFEYYYALERIDVAVDKGFAVVAPFRNSTESRNKFTARLRARFAEDLDDAEDAAHDLRKVLRLIPCGTGTTNPPGGGGGTTSQCNGTVSGSGTATQTFVISCDHGTTDTADDFVYDVAFISGNDGQLQIRRAPNAQSCGAPAGWFGGQGAPPNSNSCGFFQTSGTATAGPHTFTVTWASVPAAVSAIVSQGNGTPVPVTLTPG
jgi:hypothetical protein